MDNGYYCDINEIEGYNKFNLWLLKNQDTKLVGKYKNNFGDLSWQKNEKNPFRQYNLVDIEHHFKSFTEKFDSGLAKRLLEQDSPEEVKKILIGFFE